ncbi:MAG: restriction endonuclease subunit S [Thermomicrobiales bacterium]
MSDPYPLVPLNSAIRHRKEFIQINDLDTYKRCRVQLHAQGIVLRDIVAGAEVKTKMQQVCQAGDFLVAEIDAKVGGFGIVPNELDGAIVSSHYFLFDIDKCVLDRRFLDYYIRTPAFKDQVSAQGSTNYAAIRPAHVLAYHIPLPPLVEQRRIVARIETVAAKITEARGLRQQATTEADNLPVVMAHRPDLHKETKLRSGWREVAIGDIVKQVQDPVQVDPARSYPNLGIYSFGRGLFTKPPIEGLATSANVLYRVQSGQFIYSRLFAFEGSYGRVSDEFDGCFVSGEYPTFACDSSSVNAEFLHAYFKVPHIWSEVAMGSKGLGDRRQRVQPNQVFAHRLLLPPMEWQREIATVQAQVDAMRRLQAETAVELAALLPAVLDRAFRGEL